MREVTDTFQLVLPRIHCRNSVEQAIQTFKNHFIALLYGIDDKFPANQWDRLVKHAVITLNMLRPSRINPLLSAYNQLWGNFDFNSTPLAPPGCKVIVHESPTDRGTWASHGVIGYYCEPSLKHYRNFQCYIPETNGMRDGVTIDFFPKLVQMPKTSSADRLAACIEDMEHIIKHPHPATLLDQQGAPINDAIRKLQEIFSPPTTKQHQEKQRFPRVAKQNHSFPRVKNNSTPRVAKTVTAIGEENNQYPIGTIIKKKFRGKLHTGTVTRYDDQHQLY